MTIKLYTMSSTTWCVHVLIDSITIIWVELPWKVDHCSYRRRAWVRVRHGAGLGFQPFNLRMRGDNVVSFTDRTENRK